MSVIAIPPETRRRQRLATDPRASAWVSANAGSGKTWVLTRRVIRLLLAGTDPGRILCLTFTKAAAAEMANRVFDVLAPWATLADDALAAEIEALEDAPPSPERLADARRLFARALETPGGLKVQTIHAFCEALLQRFSVEANLSGRFEVLDDRAAALMLAEARNGMIAETIADPSGPVAGALARLLADNPDATVERALAEMVGARENVRAWIEAAGSLDAALASLPAALGAPPGRTEGDLVAAVSRSPVFEGPMLSRLIDVLDRTGASTMLELADGFRAALDERDDEARRVLWRGLFLTRDLKPRKTPVTKAVVAAIAGIAEQFAAEAERILAVEQSIVALAAAERTDALVRVADRVIGLYQALKTAQGTLDYDDLIQRTADLLSRSDAAAWVQYKLDEGLDHILVDEAQDTSPRQWDIVRALVDDFFAGAGARGRLNRTVFAVGDEKQSIYSFQGAAPHLFGATREELSRKVRDAGATFHDLELTLSFRSTPAVVKGVDRVFAGDLAHAGLSSRGGPPVHETVRAAEPGVVEVWPEVESDRSPEPERWEDPVDKTGSGSGDARLAEAIATEIAGWLETGERLPATGQRIRPGDILILVRKRGVFVEAVNRALKARRVPVAGADRLDVVGHIVVQDLMAAARTALLPEDDLALATVARSPLVGISEDELFDLAHRRGARSLWSAVCAAAGAGNQAAGRLTERVRCWIRRADRSEPHGFFAALVGVDGARAVYRARFGREADEVIDEFLGLALAFEQRETADLTGFLIRLADTAEEVKREVEAGRDEVRVMTVHGAKGLEAPVVFLVDPGAAPVSKGHDPLIVRLGEPGAPLVWAAGSLKPAPVEAALAGHRNRSEEEYRRLLYVGLTRARDRLVVTGVKRARGGGDGRWHQLVTSALQYDAESYQAPDGSVRWIWQSDPNLPVHPPSADPAQPPPASPLPDFLSTPMPAPETVAAITPSGAGVLLAGVPAAARTERDGPGPRGPDTPATIRGTLVHRLFELLPEVDAAERRHRAAAWLSREAPSVAPQEREAILSTVLAILEDPASAPLFGPRSRAEVGLIGTIVTPDGRSLSVSGQIDRLVAGDDATLILDFKTNRSVPTETPAGYVAQLALYRALLQDLRPGIPVRAALLWTETGEIRTIPDAALDDALRRILTQV